MEQEVVHSKGGDISTYCRQQAKTLETDKTCIKEQIAISGNGISPT